jgi:hypothetical protein
LGAGYNSFVSDIYLVSVDVTIVKIYGDDKLLYTSPGMTVSTLKQSVNLDISGVSQLKIEIDFEEDRSPNANVTLAEAHLIN